MPRTPVSILFRDKCWLFLRAMDPEVVPAQLSPELREVLDRTPAIRTRPSDPQPRYVVDMLRSQAYALLEHIAAMHRALAADDDRRRLCEQCLDDLNVAIRPSRGI